ncbi:MAG: hypothetical protein UR26_C0002G0039 [candidate division TM6 bacterium GW2011_GWF2_32_72]|nr:MAG: hypothetical protein UR26_C0002G0039 [candidate division TM6 bacterium GW2011_GWF2_32_72]
MKYIKYAFAFFLLLYGYDSTCSSLWASAWGSVKNGTSGVYGTVKNGVSGTYSFLSDLNGAINVNDGYEDDLSDSSDDDFFDTVQEPAELENLKIDSNISVLSNPDLTGPSGKTLDVSALNDQSNLWASAWCSVKNGTSGVYGAVKSGVSGSYSYLSNLGSTIMGKEDGDKSLKEGLSINSVSNEDKASSTDVDSSKVNVDQDAQNLSSKHTKKSSWVNQKVESAIGNVLGADTIEDLKKTKSVLKFTGLLADEVKKQNMSDEEVYDLAKNVAELVKVGRKMSIFWSKNGEHISSSLEKLTCFYELIKKDGLDPECDMSYKDKAWDVLTDLAKDFKIDVDVKDKVHSYQKIGLVFNKIIKEFNQLIDKAKKEIEEQTINPKADYHQLVIDTENLIHIIKQTLGSDEGLFSKAGKIKVQDSMSQLIESNKSLNDYVGAVKGFKGVSKTFGSAVNAVNSGISYAKENKIKTTGIFGGLAVGAAACIATVATLSGAAIIGSTWLWNKFKGLSAGEQKHWMENMDYSNLASSPYMGAGEKISPFSSGAHTAMKKVLSNKK